MTRYVEIKEDGLFAWYNTTSESFVEYMGSVSWESFEDFMGDVFDSGDECSDETIEHYQKRYPKDWRSE